MGTAESAESVREELNHQMETVRNSRKVHFCFEHAGMAAEQQILEPWQTLENTINNATAKEIAQTQKA